MSLVLLIGLVILSISHLVESNGGVYWCDFDKNPKNTIKNRSIRSKKDLSFVELKCDDLSLLTSAADSYEVFDNKISEVIRSKSFVLERENMLEHVWNKYVAQSAELVPFIYKEAYILMLWALKNLRPNQNDLWMEFGVYQGFSVNISSFQKYKSQDPVYGFDSFVGLPTVWKNDVNSMPAGFFSLNGVLPPVRKNVKLIPGWFNETLPKFLSQHPTQKVSFVNVDNDLYEGSVDILTSLMPRFQNQTVIHFHELFQFNSRANTITGNSEMRALYDVMKAHPKFKVQFIPIQGMFKEPAVFRVLEI